MAKITEKELMEQITNTLADIDMPDFVQICNDILGTNYTEDDIEWGNSQK